MHHSENKNIKKFLTVLIKRRKVMRGLVLEGGGAKGAYHRCSQISI